MSQSARHAVSRRSRSRFPLWVGATDRLVSSAQHCARLRAQWADGSRPRRRALVWHHERRVLQVHGDVDARTMHVNGRPVPAFDQLAWFQATGAARLPAVVAGIGLTPERIAGRHADGRTCLEDHTPGRRRLAALIGD